MGLDTSNRGKRCVVALAGCAVAAVIMGCGDDDSGGGGRTRPQGELLTSAILQSDANCFRARAVELISCMNAGTPSAGASRFEMTGMIAADTCAEAGTSRLAVLDPAPTPGSVSASYARTDRSHAYRNGASECGTFAFLYPEDRCTVFRLETSTGWAESEACTTVRDAADTRYNRLECSDGSLFTANADQIAPIYAFMPVLGASGSADSFQFEIEARGPELKTACSY